LILTISKIKPSDHIGDEQQIMRNKIPSGQLGAHPAACDCIVYSKCGPPNSDTKNPISVRHDAARRTSSHQVPGQERLATAPAVIKAEQRMFKAAGGPPGKLPMT
jgi:hypothetical protein